MLLRTISNLLDKDRHPYARHAYFVNSSGTGKSRMVDQLAKRVITVPMCLRTSSNEGHTFCSFILVGLIS